MSKQILPPKVKVGETYGRWVVMDVQRVGWYYKAMCSCVCGSTKSVRQDSLISGDSTSCGCLAREKARERFSTKGGLTTHPLYQRWYDLNRRCYDPERKDYNHYGGRGITVCQEWHRDNPQGFQNFLRDMGGTYQDKLEIDRIDNNGNYCKDNCKWSTRSEQVVNSRDLGGRIGRPNFLDDGQEVLHLAAMAKKYNLNAGLLQDRVDKLGMSLTDALSMPVKTKKYFLIFNGIECTIKDVFKYPCHASNEAKRLGITLHEVLYLMFGDNIEIEGIVNKQRVKFPAGCVAIEGTLRNIKVNAGFDKYLLKVTK